MKEDFRQYRLPGWLPDSFVAATLVAGAGDIKKDRGTSHPRVFLHSTTPVLMMTKSMLTFTLMSLNISCHSSSVRLEWIDFVRYSSPKPNTSDDLD